MTDLSQESLEQVLVELRQMERDRGVQIRIMPTHWFLIQFDGESYEDFCARVQKACQLVAQMQGKKP